MTDFDDTDHDDPATHVRRLAQRLADLEQLHGEIREGTVRIHEMPAAPDYHEHELTAERAEPDQRVLAALDEMHAEIRGAREELAGLRARVNTLGRHVMGIAAHTGYSVGPATQAVATQPPAPAADG